MRRSGTRKRTTNTSTASRPNKHAIYYIPWNETNWSRNCGTHANLKIKFITSFDTFLTTHVLDNYHLSDAEKEFVDARIKILLNDSKRHLGIFKSILGETEADTSIPA